MFYFSYNSILTTERRSFGNVKIICIFSLRTSVTSGTKNSAIPICDPTSNTFALKNQNIRQNFLPWWEAFSYKNSVKTEIFGVFAYYHSEILKAVAMKSKKCAIFIFQGFNKILKRPLVATSGKNFTLAQWRRFYRKNVCKCIIDRTT